MKRIITAAMIFALALGMLCIPANAEEGVPALSTDIAFECNAVPMNIETYSISDYGFYKLRDIAAMCDGTEKEFSVVWDGERGMITLTSGEDYTVSENDLQPGGGQTQTAYISSAVVIVNGAEVSLTAYNINGYTYYKLRELCSALDIFVSWNEDTRTSGIDTAKNYDGSEVSGEPEQPTEDEFTAEDFANASPRTNEEFYELICYMRANGITSFTDTIEDVSFTQSEFESYFGGLVDGFHYGYAESSEDYLYHMTFFEGIAWQYSWWYDSSGTIHKFAYTLDFTLRDNMTLDETLWKIDAFTEACCSIIDELYAEGELSDAMTDREKAQVLYEYLDHRFQYDDNYYDVPAYDAIMNDRAVCEGYTAIYNYLCNLLGIPAKAAFGASGSEAHVWTVVVSGGETYYIDVTWGDPIPDRGENYSDLSYFWISYDELMRLDPKRVFYDSMPWE